MDRHERTASRLGRVIGWTIILGVISLVFLAIATLGVILVKLLEYVLSM